MLDFEQGADEGERLKRTVLRRVLGSSGRFLMALEGSRLLMMKLRIFWKLSRDSSRCPLLGLTAAIPSSRNRLVAIDGGRE